MDSEVIPANLVLFEDFCLVLEQLEKMKKSKNPNQGKIKNVKQEQVMIISNFFNEFKVKACLQEKSNHTIFPILRLLLPECDRERNPYNLKEFKLAKVLIKILSIKQSNIAHKLQNYRSGHGNSSDFAEVAYFAIKNIIGSRSGQLTIGKINDILEKISLAEVGNKQNAFDAAFSEALKNLSPMQLKWFLRIILKDLKVGVGTNRILSALHPDAVELYQNCSSLSQLCEELKDGETRPLELGIKLYYAVSAMLSERLEVTQVSQQLSFNSKSYVVENKFDGERFQIHMENGIFEYFSRRGHPYSDKYGKTYLSGLLTPYLKDCFDPEVSSFILDGEMMGWHKLNQHFSCKGIAFDVKKITERSQFRPCFCAFDVLYYNGKTLVGPPEKGGIPLKERLRILDSMFTPVTGVIQLSQRETVRSGSEILDKLNEAIENQDEGIIVKDIDSFYIPSKRNAGWYKIKPEYTKSTMTDLDLVIIGADEAENKRQGRAKCFHVACIDNSDTDAPLWLSVGRVATGLTHDERERICLTLEKLWQYSRVTAPPPQLVFNKETPDLWLLPDHSIVLQVRATELIRSTNYGTTYTLRFPRVERVREDKPVADIMTLAEFEALHQNKGSVIKLSSKRVNEDSLVESGTNVKKKRPTKVAPVAEQFKVTITEPVEVISKALFGRKICILTGDDDDKVELRRIVESHSGKFVANIGADTWCSVVGRITERERRVIESKHVNVVSTTWLRSLPPSDDLCVLPLNSVHLLALNKATRMHFARDFDVFGDSYTTPIDVDTMKTCFERMDKYEPAIYLTKKEMMDLDLELFGESNPYSFLRLCSIHITDDSSILAMKARMYGATICEFNSPNLTHIVLCKNTKSENELKLRTAKAPIVSEEWLEQCFKLKKLLPESEFIV